MNYNLHQAVLYNTGINPRVQVFVFMNHGSLFLFFSRCCCCCLFVVVVVVVVVVCLFGFFFPQQPLFPQN